MALLCVSAPLSSEDYAKSAKVRKEPHLFNLTQINLPKGLRSWGCTCLGSVLCGTSRVVSTIRDSYQN